MGPAPAAKDFLCISLILTFSPRPAAAAGAAAAAAAKPLPPLLLLPPFSSALSARSLASASSADSCMGMSDTPRRRIAFW